MIDIITIDDDGRVVERSELYTERRSEWLDLPLGDRIFIRPDWPAIGSPDFAAKLREWHALHNPVAAHRTKETHGHYNDDQDDQDAHAANR